jgi:hypothetical protein
MFLFLQKLWRRCHRLQSCKKGSDVTASEYGMPSVSGPCTLPGDFGFAPDAAARGTGAELAAVLGTLPDSAQGDLGPCVIRVDVREADLFLLFLQVAEFPRSDFGPGFACFFLHRAESPLFKKEETTFFLKKKDEMSDTAIEYLHIRSMDRNRVTYPSPCDFTIPLTAQILRAPIRFQLYHVSIPYLVYNIESGANAFPVVVSPTTYTVTVTPGYYTVGQFCVELQRALNASGAGSYTCTFNINTFRVTIARSTGTFTLNLTSVPKLAALIGFRNVSYTGAISYTSDSTSMPGGSSADSSLYIDIAPSSGGAVYSTAEIGIFHTFIVQNTVNPGEYIMLRQQTHDGQPMISRTYWDDMTELRIQMRDSNGEILRLLSDWEMTLYVIRTPQVTVSPGAVVSTVEESFAKLTSSQDQTKKRRMGLFEWAATQRQ